MPRVSEFRTGALGLLSGLFAAGKNKDKDNDNDFVDDPGEHIQPQEGNPIPPGVTE